MSGKKRGNVKVETRHALSLQRVVFQVIDDGISFMRVDEAQSARRGVGCRVSGKKGAI